MCHLCQQVLEASFAGRRLILYLQLLIDQDHKFLSETKSGKQSLLLLTFQILSHVFSFNLNSDQNVNV